MSTVAGLHRRLQQRGETVAVAESLTGGLVAGALTETPGSSRSFRGGLVVYATDLKASIGGVPAHLLAEHGPVDAQVAAQLARHVREALGATYGLALTGVAGPEPQEGKPVGLVYIALAGPGVDRVREGRYAGSRRDIRAAAVTEALGLLECALPPE